LWAEPRTFWPQHLIDLLLAFLSGLLHLALLEIPCTHTERTHTETHA